MTPPPLDVSPLVRQRAMANGAVGRRWLDELPGVVEALAQRWDLRLGRAMRGGTASYVAEAIDGGGRECVLKVAMALGVEERDAFARSVLAHELDGGVACAALLAHDVDAPAMLLEQLGANLHDLGTPVPAVLETVATTLRYFWRPVAPETALPTGADKAAWLAASITTSWDALGRPCDVAVIDRAVAYCDERADAFDASAAVLVHGDAHGWNTLDAGDGRCKFVDPEGLRSEPAHDLGVPMREYNEPLLDGDTVRLVRARAETLASSCAVDPEAVWQWGFIERVATGLVGLRDFEGDASAVFLEVATRCL